MRINVILGAVATLAVGSAAATPAPSCTPSGQLGASDTNDETGHFYQVYSAPGITWGAAKAAVDDLPEYQGVKGHLATITSASEDTWVNGLRQTAVLCAPEVWIGGVQPPEQGDGRRLGLGQRRGTHRDVRNASHFFLPELAEWRAER